MANRDRPSPSAADPTVVAPPSAEALGETLVAREEVDAGVTMVSRPPGQDGEATVAAPLPAARMASTGSLEGGELVGGRFRILGLLGQGGMGCVYQVRDVELDEVVALKMLRRDRVADPEELERFRREARLARRVTHPNVARIFDIGEHGAEKFITMELVEGESLADLLARKGPLPLDRLVHVGRQLCAGLSAAHEAGVIHRDLKPANVLVDRAGRAVITDFGIARDLGPGHRSGGVAETVGVIGTPAYMAPEQMEGGPVDARTDVFAAGVVLYELSSGGLPFLGQTPMAMAAARLSRAPRDPRLARPDLPPALVEVLMRALARRPEDRFPTAAALGQALVGLAAAAPVITGPRARVGFLQQLLEAERSVHTLAVLPMRNAGLPTDQHWAEGFTLDLTESLSLVPRLKVRSGAHRLSDAEADPRAVGRALGVQVVVEGSVRRHGELLRVQVRLVSVGDGFQIWAHRFDRQQGEFLAIAEEAAQAIAQALLRPSLPAGARPGLRNPEALDLYLRARQEYHSYTGPAMARAVGYLDQALQLAPDEPRLLTALSAVCVRAWALDANIPDRDGVLGDRARERALEAGQRALELAPDLGEPHVGLALLRIQEKDLLGAIPHIKQAVLRAPGLAPAHENLGRLLLEVDHLELAIVQLETALALEPDLHTARMDLARAYAYLGQRDKAMDVARQINAAEGFAGWLVFRRLGVWFDPRPTDWLLEIPGDPADPLVAALRQMAHAEYTGTAQGSRLVEPGRTVRRRDAFITQLRVEFAMHGGQLRRARELLALAPEMGVVDLTWMRRCPLLRPLHHEPEYQEALRKIEAAAGRLVAALST
jgi:serine/threonine protein kinase/tetratricopeptide (TPR) repeat protein